MPSAKIPPDNHVTRYVRKRLLRRDEDDNVIGILPQALELREGEAYLSVTWLEHFAADYEQALSKAAEAIRRQLSVKNGDGFSVAGVDNICDICEDFGVKVRVLHEPKPPENTGYGALRGLPRDDLELLGMLSFSAFVDTRIAAAIPTPVCE